MKLIGLVAVIAILLISLTSCTSKSNNTQNELEAGKKVERRTKVEVPEWAKKSVLYELNIRQFTPEGTFLAIIPHLDRLNDMGIDIIWLMPVHSISVTKRKGTLGSYYAVNDYRSVNPEYGTERELQQLIGEIHNRGMKVLIDWVPHHTGWDHAWIENHPEWYSQDSLGNIIDPINEEEGEPWGWTDVAEIDLSNQDMRAEIISDMKYWLEEYDVDGFRVDHAHGLPDDYWNQVSDSLAQLDIPVFMLAEGEEPRLRNEENFVMTYAWKFYEAMDDIAEGTKGVNFLDTLLAEDSVYTFGYHLYFTTNHDKNSWEGTVFERLGDGVKTFAVLVHTVDGMPLIYSGQEAPVTRRLEFFEKDPIDWNNYAYADFYTTLNKLKKHNHALWNGEHGGKTVRINISDYVYAFRRVREGDTVVVILNLSDKQRETSLTTDVQKMRDVFTGEMRQFKAGESLVLEPWEYIVLSNK